jgi:hypothetical protein
MHEPEDQTRRRSVLIWTVKTVLAVGFLSFCASTWLSGPALDHGTLARLAAVTSRGADDPVTTGSILRSAAGAKLDPCVASPRRP